MISRWLTCNDTPHAMRYQHGIGVFSTEQTTQRLIEAQHLRGRKAARAHPVAGPHSPAPTRMRERFLLLVTKLLDEAKSAAALDHPNIAVVHEVGETDEGRLFIAMAYYEGETLREKIRRGGE